MTSCEPICTKLANDPQAGDTRILQKSSSHLKILGGRTLTRNSHTENPQTLRAYVHSSLQYILHYSTFFTTVHSSLRTFFTTVHTSLQYILHYSTFFTTVHSSLDVVFLTGIFVNCICLVCIVVTLCVFVVSYVYLYNTIIQD